MNPYGDPNSVRGRAQVPGPADASGPDDDAGFPVHRAAGHGRASVGSASVRPPGGSPAVGAARVGRAGVPRPGGDDGGYPGVRGTAGRATVGRAVVRPVSPAGPGEAGPELGAPIRGAKSPAAAKRAKKRRRANWLIGSLAVLVILAGSSVMAFTYYYDKVPAADYTEVETTTITYANGAQLAKIGEQNRQTVPADKISPVVTRAVMAAEDKNFMDHGGIDLKGIARAAWNNFSGGSTQGASTITQQYARHAADLNEISVNRKIREAMLSRKIEADMTKEEILGKYLNAIYFGRGAHGVEAAAQAYFKKSVQTPPGQKDALTVEEAAVLASVIKQPEFDATTGHKGYDPQVNLEAAKERWAYTLGNMQEKGWITPDQRANAKYPAVRKYDPKRDCATGCVGKTPLGNIVNRVKEELTAMGISWEKGGYKITTTINPKAQAAAENAARNSSVGSPMNKLPKEYRAALVAVEPGSGRVIAYYGGDDGTGVDWAGLNEIDGKIVGGHPPGSSFKVFTLAAALKEGYSFDSRWDATEKTPDGKEINNAGRKIPCGKSCDLERSTVQSYNFAFYWLADKVGVDKVLAAAKSAGINSMWNDDGKFLDLAKENLADAKSKLGIDNQVGFGQYAVTVLDQANGVATLANRGRYNKAHFVKTVQEKNLAGEWITRGGEQLKPREAFPAAQMDNLNGVLQKIPAVGDDQLRGARPATGKTGTWEFDKKDNAHAWMIGATPQVASAVWVGAGDKGGPIRESGGKPMGGSGTPGAIWKVFMDDVHKALDLPVKAFPDRQLTGDPNNPPGNGIAPQKPATGGNAFCDQLDPAVRARFCPETGDNNNGGGNNGNENNGNENNGNENNGNQGNQGNNGNQGNGNGNANGGVQSPFDRNRIFNTPSPPG